MDRAKIILYLVNLFFFGYFLRKDIITKKFSFCNLFALRLFCCFFRCDLFLRIFGEKLNDSINPNYYLNLEALVIAQCCLVAFYVECFLSTFKVNGIKFGPSISVRFSTVKNLSNLTFIFLVSM